MKLNRGHFICPKCKERTKRTSGGQQYCKICSVINKKEHLDRLHNSRKGKTYEEIFGIKITKRLLERRKEKLNHADIICSDCGGIISKTGTRQFFCKECSKKRDNNNKSNWRTKNKILSQKIIKRWKEKNKLKLNLYTRKRIAKKKEIIEVYSLEQWMLKLESTKGICPECKTFVGIKNLTMDHIYPISKAEIGRSYTINDIQPMCQSCNSRKGVKV